MDKKYISGKVKSGNLKKNVIISISIALVLIAAIFAVRGFSGESKEAAADTDLTIPKGEITGTARFFPVKSGGTKMEVLAVKASDGSIRTAFNTCQVCNGSPRAYYKQEGNVVVCQNCGNRFEMDMIEQQRGGCNPVPILKESKTENRDSIIIPKAFIQQNKNLFTENWKTE